MPATDLLADTSHRLLHAIATKYTLPDYVASAAILTKAAAADFPQGLFALPYQRAYPLDSPASTWLSAASMMTEPPVSLSSLELNEAAGRIIKAAQHYGILEDVIAVFYPPQEKVAEAPVTYGMIIKQADGEELKLYPMRGPADVLAATEHFEKHANQLPTSHRAEIAKTIVKVAQQLGLSLQPLSRVQKEAGTAPAYPDLRLLATDLRARGQLLRKQGDATGDSKRFADIVEALTKLSAEHLIQARGDISHQLGSMDDALGLRQHYGAQILPPSDFMFAIPVEHIEAIKAAEADTVYLGEHPVSLTKLAALGPMVFTTYFGPAFTSKLLGHGPASHINKQALAAALSEMDDHTKTAFGDYLANA